MKHCESLRGFFTLYHCPKPSEHTCSQCKRNMCNEHFIKETEICVECTASSETADENDPIVKIYRARKEMMLEKTNNPIYFGTELSEYYSEYDARAFDVTLAKVENMTDSPDELFYES